MSKKLSIIILLCVAVLLPNIATAQEFTIFAKQKVVIADINDVNERKLNDGIKQVIRQGIIDACTNSSDYEVFEVNIEDIKRRITANGQKINFANICKTIGSRADYIIFTNIKLSSSELGAQNITIYVTSSLYRIATGSEIKTQVTETLPNSQSIVSSTSQLVANLLGIEQKVDKPVANVPTNEINQEHYSADSLKELDEKGVELFRQKRYEEAVQCYRRAAEQGYAPAQNHLGVCYKRGKGVPRDYNEAVQWYRKAAEQGHTAAQSNLAECYYYGRGVTEDHYEAVKWARKAADEGNRQAQYRLGYCYSNGKGVTQDRYEGVHWYRKAAEQGHTAAQSNLAECYYYGRGVTEDHYEAVKWARKAAEKGNRQALFRLGYCYNNGKGVAQDRHEGVRWYREAAEKGHTIAQFNLGLCYELGRGVEQDKAEAKRWYQKAADKGHPRAKEKLNNM
ncbi:MAG: sel1 repeat family protein [Alistipes sp.]|nr:sel1 repeat family protein [Alistipes sp.]